MELFRNSADRQTAWLGFVMHNVKRQTDNLTRHPDPNKYINSSRSLGHRQQMSVFDSVTRSEKWVRTVLF